MKPKLLSRAFSNLRRICRFNRLRDVAITALLLVLFVALLPTSAWPQTQWIKHNNNPVLTPTSGGFEEEGLFEPVVIFDGARYHMWYDGTSQSETSFATGYATSSDGITWTKYAGNPVLQGGPAGSWDDQGGFPSTVLFDGTSFKMWYTGSDGNRFRFGYATSSDGIQWTKHANNPILDVGTLGTWDSDILFLPDVHFDGTTYHMWYDGFPGPGIGHATSSDGVRWGKDPTNPIFIGAPRQSWERQGVGHPRVLFDGQKYRLWYIGVDEQINIPLAMPILR